MGAQRKPVRPVSGRLPNSFAVAAETDRKHSQALAQIQVRDLRPSEVPAARLAYALTRAYPKLHIIEIAERLARDHGYYGGRWRQYRCSRLRRMIALYAEFVDAGVEPAPETIFGD